MGADSHFIHTADVQRAIITRDAYSEDVETWPPDIPAHLTGVRGRLVIQSEFVGDTAFAEKPFTTTYRWMCGSGVDVRQGDRIANVIDERGATLDSGPFHILEVLPRRGKAIRHKTLTLERVGRTS